ncbi:hypothetical protein [Streptomyces sp. CBMA156]|uniref:hypothetical protein n=1 Tax=Streptomyces sp. CBMA156 TaxID=1930280 RepID=UPI001661F29F|nr:hypothetical protein [Streptomyces sp. CBMA156]
MLSFGGNVQLGELADAVDKHLKAEHRKPRMRKRQSRVEVAERIADAALRFVYEARVHGSTNLVTSLTLEESAQTLGYTGGTHYTVSTVKRAAARLAAERGWEALLASD